MKAKEFYRRHKKLILIGTGAIIVIGVVVLFTKNKTVLERTGKAIISWTPTDDSISLERVKEVLDLNAKNLSQYAIFREGVDPSKYVCVVLSDSSGFISAL